MMRSLGSTLTIASIISIVPAFAGCAITNNADGSSTATSLTTYEGTALSPDPINYSAGQGVRIIGANGAISVSSTGGSAVGVVFKPFTKDKGDSAGEKQAQDEMSHQIHYAAQTRGGEIVIEVTRDGGSNTYLGADIAVTIPTAFNGAFTVQQGNGSVDAALGGGATSVTVTNSGAGDIAVNGVSGRLAISGDFDVSVGVTAWAPAGQDGSVSAGDLGSIAIRIPASATGSLTAQAGQTISDGGLPSNWTSAESAANSKSYTMGSGAGAKVSLVAGENISISN